MAHGGSFDPRLPKLFIEELKRGFFEQDAERYADGVSDHHVAWEDVAHGQTEHSDEAEIEQGENTRQGHESDVDDEDGQSQVDRDLFGNDDYENDEYDSDAIDSGNSSEAEEDSDVDDDDDDYDDVD